ncbi:T9SS type A sorting domain-containing protein, partial [Maridesulfovibrio ferrireducens]|uniref:T9SS type A sorting domain-containing protein n=1 Tax=Maridesulfovibrio ferrireducens TaxID=246191 RepID=UPI001A1AFEA6
VTLTGSGFVMPAGNHHDDPIVLTLADEIIETGSTTIYDTYYPFCSSQSVVYQLTLATTKLMSISLEGTTWDTKLYVFNSYQQIDQATSADDAWYYNDDETSAGTGGAKSKSRATWSEMLETLSPAGDYFIVISGYSSTHHGAYTMTINTADYPVPGAATSPSPADDAVDQATALTLEWTNPAYTETIDLYFGTPGSKSLAKVLDNVAAVEEYEVTDLDPDTEYNWYVVCRNTSGSTPPENIVTWSFTTIGNPPLGTSYTSPADASTDRPLSGNLYWSAATNASGYKVFLSEDNTFTGHTHVSQPGTTYAYSGLDYETTYYWKIVPYNVVGDASEGIDVWSFTTIPDPTIAMPVSLDFEGTTENPAAITLENCTIGTHHGSESNILYKNVWNSSSDGYVQFQSMNNITENSVINFDYRIVNYNSPWGATTLLADHDYFVAKVSTDNGVNFTAIDQINSLNHTSTQDMTNYTIDIGAYAGQTAIFRFEMDWAGSGDYYFDLDNIFFGNAPQVTVNPGDGSPTDPIVLGDENVELEFTAPNPAGFSLQIFMIPSLPSNDNGLPATMDSFLPRTWRIISSVGNPGSYIITFDLAGLGITNYGLVRFFKRANGAAAWEDVINLGGSLSWNGSKVTISGLDTFSEFVPGIDETLPVTLASFNAVQTTNKFAQINWVTASENGVLGYNLFRAENDNQDQAMRVTGTMIEALNSTTGGSYSFIDDEVEMNTTYYYWLQTNDFDGTSEMFGPVTVKISDQEDHDIEEILLGTQLFSNYPNPFNPSTTISFSVAEPQVVTIDVYNVKGQLVQRVFNSKVDTPNIKQNVVWNGKDADGRNVASGIYFTIMKAGNKTFSNKAILLK